MNPPSLMMLLQSCLLGYVLYCKLGTVCYNAICGTTVVCVQENYLCCSLELHVAGELVDFFSPALLDMDSFRLAFALDNMLKNGS